MSTRWISRRQKKGQQLTEENMNSDSKPATGFSCPIGNSAFLGASPAFSAAVRAIERIAGCDATVLVQGETGTGKELAARAVHYLSARRDNPFVPVNCGAIPDGLFESELFGHCKGAFTDAKDAKPGLVALAEGGTLFLDEIECLSPKGQVALLRFLQDQSYRPVGGLLLMANVRIVAAGNQDLARMMQAGEFRRDLYYRLALLSFTMPPLRERTGDPELLAMHFIATGSLRFRVPAKPLHSSAIEWLSRYQWPGNVRELENFIYREILLSETPEIRTNGDIPAGPTDNRRQRVDRRKPSWSGMPYQRAKSIVLKDFEEQYLVRLLTQAKGNVSAAARLAGKERRNFGRLLQKNGIDKIPFCT
jgi:transcriptional regulator with PAS, ATPase and Fis domain